MSAFATQGDHDNVIVFGAVIMAIATERRISVRWLSTIRPTQMIRAESACILLPSIPTIVIYYC